MSLRATGAHLLWHRAVRIPRRSSPPVAQLIGERSEGGRKDRGDGHLTVKAAESGEAGSFISSNGKINQSRARRAPRIAPVTNPIPKTVSVVVKGFPEIVSRASSTSCPALSAASLPSSNTRSVTEFSEADLLGSTIGSFAPPPLEEGFFGAPKGS